MHISQQILTKNYIPLRHPNPTNLKKPSFTPRPKKKCLLALINLIDFQKILQYLKLNELIKLYQGLKTSKIGKEYNKSLINFMLLNDREYTEEEQKQFTLIIINRRKKAISHYKQNKTPYLIEIINQDVQRTYLSEINNLQRTLEMKKYLNNVLSTLANAYFKFGYIQGFNYIIKNMYQNNFNQTQAFTYASFLLTEMKIEDLYIKDLGKVHELCYVLEVYMFNYLPKIYHHLKDLSVLIEIFAASWFITLYAENLPKKIVNKIWNLFIIKGWKIIIKFGLAVLCTFESQICNKNSDDIYGYLRGIMLNINYSNESMIWKIMSSLKVTNKMVKLLSKQMSKVHKDVEIQLWKIKDYQKFEKDNKMDIHDRVFPASRGHLNGSFPSNICCQRYSNNGGIFLLCRNIQYSQF